MRLFDVQGSRSRHRVARFLSFCAILRICHAGRMPSRQPETVAPGLRLRPERLTLA